MYIKVALSNSYFFAFLWLTAPLLDFCAYDSELASPHNCAGFRLVNIIYILKHIILLKLILPIYLRYYVFWKLTYYHSIRQENIVISFISLSSRFYQIFRHSSGYTFLLGKSSRAPTKQAPAACSHALSSVQFTMNSIWEIFYCVLKFLCSARWYRDTVYTH